MNPLETYLGGLIKAQGPMPVAHFMAIALSHPQHGYYMKQDPFGRDGDFTTAPEISQMFGEILGLWSANIWLQMGSPQNFSFIECGPGRGTLMADMMRATKNLPGFHQACKIHLIEISPALKEKQKAALEGYNVTWHERLDKVSNDHPVILIANEFLDALPIRQYARTESGWQERCVSINAKNQFHFVPEDKTEILENSETRSFFAENVAALLKKTTGAALLIDYGSIHSGFGDTLQAVKAHKTVPVLEDIGNADLTSHVDFEALVKNIDKSSIKISGPVEQGAFLKENGIDMRAERLSAAANAAQKTDIENALKRLTDSDQMGSLFKVIGLSSGNNINPTGFGSA